MKSFLWSIFFAVLSLQLLNSCEPAERKSETTIQPVDATYCELSDADLKNFTRTVSDLELKKFLNDFYSRRKYRHAFTNSNGPVEIARNFINFLENNHESEQHIRAALRLQYSSLLSDTSYTCNDSATVNFELALTSEFFNFARRSWEGSPDSVLKRVEWFIGRKRLDYHALLEQFIKATDVHFLNEPVYPQYALLKKELEKYNGIDLLGGWLPIEGEKIKLRLGDSSEHIPRIRQHLYMCEYLESQSTSYFFDDTLQSAVKIFQRCHGLPDDGVISEKTIAALNVPAYKRVQQIMVNMERCRWIPLNITGDYILVNIPEFKLHTYKNNKHHWSCNVIVGLANEINNTVVFNDTVEFVVFNPYWSIPQNIITRETLPSLRKDKRYLKKHNMEIVTANGRVVDDSKLNYNNYTDHFPYIIRERPGPSNSLGKVKFLFPNSWDIYMHDTPAKDLFSKPSRSFSHGCVRVERPAELAEYLLRNQPGWTLEKIEEQMSSGKENYVKLKRKTAIFIFYFTSWVDETGRLNFRDDIYGHDAKLKSLLFVN